MGIKSEIQTFNSKESELFINTDLSQATIEDQPSLLRV